MNGSFLIPESFYLNGDKIDVVIDDEYLSKKNYVGLAVFAKRQIKLCNRLNGKRLPKTEKEMNFYHELVHMILDSMGKHRLKYNEDFVEQFAQRLYEYEKTKV